ncbi:MAG: hypothetical protein QJR03_01435 [Sphaerobacter sp.]|nr:hypothetical protein [Sphaerobacter sp.]
MRAPALALTAHGADGRPLTRLRYANAPGSPDFRPHPDRCHLTLDLAAPGVGAPAARPREAQVRLVAPPEWLTLPGRVCFLPAGQTAITWTVYPRGLPAGFTARLAVEVRDGRRRLGRANLTLGITLEGFSQFRPEQHALPFANTVADLGVVRPDARLFARTYRWTPLRRAFFRGLYRAIVFLGGAPGAPQGGLCTGMARAALARSLGGLPAGADLRAAAIVLHGRQLTDRALLAAAPWVLRPSPARAFRRFRADLLARGRSDVCFDVGVPRPWRRDLVRALTREGHTVVPYGFRQDHPDRAEVLVWDPNHPAAPPDESILTVDLRGDTYGYRDRARLGERTTTIVAVRQPAYRGGRTALLASAASVLLDPAAAGLTRRRLALGGLLAAVGAATAALAAAGRSGLAGRDREGNATWNRTRATSCSTS